MIDPDKRKAIYLLHQEGMSVRQIARRFNPYWGSLIKVDNELSRFGDQVKDFACLYTSRVSNFLFYPQDRYCLSPVEFLPHEF